MAGATLWNGTSEVGVPTFSWDGTAEARATTQGMPYGYASVAAMLAAQPFYVAHRGGSLNWPEMSLRGMTESVARGVGALEVSLARSSDGVWFGMHDQTFDRTAGVTGTPEPATLTFAEINRRYRNSGDRYYTLQELVTPWAKTHVFFIDPKYNHTRMSELGPLLKTLVDPSRVVIKYFGDNAVLANAARSQGFKTWGYFYPANFDSGMFDQFKGAWDILGLSYDANATYWAQIKAVGKPVMGHICPSAAAVSSALSKGAAGCMVSGVRQAIRDAGI